jgi:hypothetical protein
VTINQKAEELMTNELAVRNETRLAGLAAFAQDNDTVMLAGDPLYFKKGFWFRGEKEFDPSGHHFLVNHLEAYTGWTRWSDRKPVDQRLVRCADYSRKEPREALGFTDKNQWETNDRGAPQDPWQPSDRIVLRTMDSGEDLLTFITGSTGGRNAIAKLLGKVARSPNAAAGKMPVVELQCGTYIHDDYGTVNYPIFHIIDWAYWDHNDEPQSGARVALPMDDEIPFEHEWRG